MRIYAHRGLSGTYPENTLLAFRKAVEAGVDGIELDLQFSKDGKLVIMHDERLLRTTGLSGCVSDYPLDELQKMDASAGIPGSFEYTPVPGFDDYCRYIKDLDIMTNIEIKTNKVHYPGIEEEVLEVIRSYALEEKTIISSFNWLTVLLVRKLAPHLQTALLQEDHLTSMIGHLASAHGIAYYHPDVRLIDEKSIRDCREHGLAVNLWTVNDLECLQQCRRWQVDGVISNRPDILLAGL